MRYGGGRVWRKHVVEEWCCSLSEIIVSGLYRIEQSLDWALIRIEAVSYTDLTLAQMTMQNICKNQHSLQNLYV